MPLMCNLTMLLPMTCIWELSLNLTYSLNFKTSEKQCFNYAHMVSASRVQELNVIIGGVLVRAFIGNG